MKPVIGLSAYFVAASEFAGHRVRGRADQNMMMSTMDYSEAVVRAGGVPFLVAPIDSEDYLEHVVNQIDGLLLTGGGDVSPQHYNQPFMKGLGNLEPVRDDVELKLIELAIKKNIPIFGICRGFQLMNVFFKGSLIQDIGMYYDTTIEHVGMFGTKDSIAHRVKVDEDCLLASCFKEDEIGVNSLHHQIIDALGEDLVACGWSEDGAIEAYYHKERPYVFAVQWHPEMMSATSAEHLNIFKLFVGLAENNQSESTGLSQSCS
ncbi:MAG: gamma-glutamyl-gamma-aminobutyrate hydrolase family protein [Clostridia bacterium]|nr:gamma-glutamyl-gamma-aminobutyrate hydrolase family protein [Clostridia bacterium]